MKLTTKYLKELIKEQLSTNEALEFIRGLGPDPSNKELYEFGLLVYNKFRDDPVVYDYAQPYIKLIQKRLKMGLEGLLELSRPYILRLEEIWIVDFDHDHEYSQEVKDLKDAWYESSEIKALRKDLYSLPILAPIHDRGVSSLVVAKIENIDIGNWARDSHDSPRDENWVHVSLGLPNIGSTAYIGNFQDIPRVVFDDPFWPDSMQWLRQRVVELDPTLKAGLDPSNWELDFEFD